MPRKPKTDVDLVRRIVSRRTHGAAFNPPIEGYTAMMARIRGEVQRDLETMPRQEFLDKYRIWLS